MKPGQAPRVDDGGAAQPSAPLAACLDNTLPPLPARERRHHSQGVVRCTNKVVTLERDIDEWLLLRPGPGPLHPGTRVPATASLASDRPIPTLPPTTLVWHLRAAGRPTGIRRQVAPEPGALSLALPQMLAAWQAAGGSDPQLRAMEARPGATRVLCSKAYDYAQLALDLAMAPAWASPELRAQLDPGDPRDGGLGEQTVVVARLQQVQFSLVAEESDEPGPSAAGCEAGPSDASQASLAGGVAPGLMARIQQVDYGRIVFVKMETRGCPMRMDAEAALRLALGERQGHFTASARHERLASASRFTVLFVGETGEATLRIEAAEGPVALRALLALPPERRSALPSAIACRLRWLEGARPWALRLSTRYNHLECTLFEPAQLVLRHRGAYAARFALSWELEDDAGGQQTTRWTSGPQAAGWSHTLRLDGDVRNLRIQAWAATGPAWAPWVTVFEEMQPGPVSRVYTVEGSSASPQWRFRDLPQA